MMAPSNQNRSERLPGVSSILHGMREFDHAGGERGPDRNPLLHHIKPEIVDRRYPDSCARPANFHTGGPLRLFTGVSFDSSSGMSSPDLPNSPSSFSGAESLRHMELNRVAMVSTVPSRKPGQKRYGNSRRGAVNSGRGRKEKNARDDQGSVLCAMEDIMECYAGWELDTGVKAQLTGANATGSGLNSPKIVVLTGISGVAKYYMHKEFCRAVREGKVEEARQELRTVINTAVSDWHDDRSLFQGTFLAPEPWEQPCQHDDKKDPCIVHTDENGKAKPHRQCRKALMDARFAHSANEHIKKMSPS